MFIFITKYYCGSQIRRYEMREAQSFCGRDEECAQNVSIKMCTE